MRLIVKFPINDPPTLNVPNSALEHTKRFKRMKSVEIETPRWKFLKSLRVESQVLFIANFKEKIFNFIAKMFSTFNRFLNALKMKCNLSTPGGTFVSFARQEKTKIFRKENSLANLRQEQNREMIKFCRMWASNKQTIKKVVALSLA